MYRPSASSPDSGQTGGGSSATPHVANQVFTVFEPANNHYWVYRWNAHIGKLDAGTPTVQGGIQSVGSDGNPDSIVALTDPFAVTIAMTDGSNGSIYTKNLTTLYQLAEGKRLAAGFEANGARITFGMRQAGSNPPGVNNLFYYRSSSALPPASGYTSTSYEGWLSVFVDGEANVEPDPPATVTIAGLSSTSSASPSVVGTYTPTIIGTFRDSNETVNSFGIGQADKLKRLQYQIINHATGAVVYDSSSLNATTAEQTARQFSRVYGGPALSAGVTYRLRCKVWDLFDASSDWSALRYFQIAAGSMDTTSTPTGKQETTTPSPFVAIWRHPSLSTNAVQIKILDADTGTTLRDSGTITKTVAPNGASSVTWATTGFAALPTGTNATWIMRGRDTSGIWGSYSDPQSFTINASPTIPVAIAPPSNTVVATPPLLTVKSTDVDDSVATGLVVKARIKTGPDPVNMSFSGNINGWRFHDADFPGVVETVGYDASQDYDGIGGSAKITLASSSLSAGGSGPLFRPVRKLPVVVGQSYTMRVAVRTDNANIMPFAQFRFVDAGGSFISSVNEADWTPSANVWSLRSLTATAPTGAVYVWLGVRIKSITANQNGNIWVDAADYVGFSPRSVVPMTLRSGTTDTWDVQLTAGANASWTVTKSGTVSGGTYTLADPETGIVSGGIGATATAAATLPVLEAVYGAGNVAVTGGPLSTTPVTITLQAGLATRVVDAPVINAASLTGGGSAAVAVVNGGGGGDLNGYDTYRWDAYSGDGTFWSGDVDWSSEGLASASSPDWTFTYAYGPAPTITSPLDGSSISTATPTITYTVSGPAQSYRRIMIYRAGVLIHDRTTGTTSSLLYNVPTPLSTGELLHEGDVITIRVTVVDANGLTGTASSTVTVDFPNPPTLQPTADLHTAKGDITPTVVRITWPQTTYPLTDAGSGAFLFYNLTRRPTADAIAANPTLSPAYERIARITSPTRLTYDDHTAQANVEYIYRLTQYVLINGVDVLNSLPGEATIAVNFNATTIHDERDPDGTRIVLAARKDRTIRVINNVQILKPWGQSAPVHDRDNTFYHEVEADYVLLARSDFFVDELIRRGKAMVQNGGPIVYRDGRENVFWGELVTFTQTDPPASGPRRVHLLFRELAREVIDE